MSFIPVENGPERSAQSVSAPELLAARYRAIRGETERLAASLSAEDQSVQSMPDASPAKWHRAHTTWFFECFVLSKHLPHYRPYNSGYNFLFNSYYEAVGERHARDRRGLLTRPSAREIGEYRRYVDRGICDLLGAGDPAEAFSALVELGLQHEQQHQELLLTDVLHAFAQNPLFPAYAPFRTGNAQAAPSSALMSFDGGIVEIGHRGSAFCFDNELPRHEVLLAPFRLMNRLVTNAEWLAFIADGGYSTPAHWLADGWKCARQEHWQAPLYWRQRDGEWFAMTLSGLRPIDPDAPVCHVSYYEADAFARWLGRRLPSESEWEHAAEHLADTSGNFRDDGYLRPLPAGHGFQLFGDVWEWTQSSYSPYPGYRTPEGAVAEYNGKFMVNQMVLRGGSCVSSRNHIRASYRNFFYPHQRWQFAGLRLAEDAPVRRRRSENSFLQDVRAGLAKPAKEIPSKYFYDAEGSRLYEEISELPEYYLTRTETLLLPEIAADLRPYLEAGTALVEFGSGASIKTRILLERLSAISLYVPVDIARESLTASAQRIRCDFPNLAVRAIAGDFLKPLTPPAELTSHAVLGFFPGSTIGNLSDEEARRFLRDSRTFLGEKARLIVGIDLVKDRATLLRAYDDDQGVTAAFNKNLLVRMNRELGATFEPEFFSHLALWNARESRIEMHLVSRMNQSLIVAGRCYDFAEGETIHTENSRKYTLKEFEKLAARAGWRVERSWQSAEPAYALVLLH
ncbi:MAG TPA: ergothioneine biosynthesis protein EgtB [Rhizomicrobium sp.]|jgi:dimethylhistidine N-methyltransferase|nr:ergothioneine biosynthesis protein EgtB [Rhizomicrobium sp.]